MKKSWLRQFYTVQEGDTSAASEFYFANNRIQSLLVKHRVKKLNHHEDTIQVVTTGKHIIIEAWEVSTKWDSMILTSRIQNL